MVRHVPMMIGILLWTLALLSFTSPGDGFVRIPGLFPVSSIGLPYAEHEVRRDQGYLRKLFSIRT